MPTPDRVQGMHATPLPTAEDGFTQLGAWIRANDQRGPKQLHTLILNCAGRYFGTRLPVEEAQDLIHDVYIVALEALQQNRVREPRRLMAYVATVARRRYAAYVARRVWCRTVYLSSAQPIEDMLPDERTNVEDEAITIQHRRIAANILDSLRPRDREILMRFYILEQRPEQIMAEMSLTGTQFRLIKSRAKAAFSERVAAALKTHPDTQV